ncbi:hypothetical protein C8Q79DRAFT_382809 [Trametes meyenii]|nr:hypothetical protein C8Q79DRAFT_382809 [Trametes meyenii]
MSTTLLGEPSLFVKMANGTSYSLSVRSMPACVALQRQAQNITSLCFPRITPQDFETLHLFLERTMSLLEELSITICHPTDPTSTCLSTPTLSLTATRFPYLKKLHLDGIAITMDPGEPFPPFLRALTMKNYPGVERCVSLTRFVHALQGCSCLEIIDIHNIGYMFSHQPQDSLQPQLLRALKSFVVADQPAFVSTFLGYLRIPATANVHITADVKGAYEADFGKTFAKLLPGGPSTLPILKEITSIEVTLTENTYRLIGQAPMRNSFIVEVNLDVEMRLGIMKHGQAYESVVRNLGHVFYNSPVTVAAFIGNLSRISLESWCGSLCALPSLLKLKVDDFGDDSDAALRLFEALTLPRTSNDARVICPHLQILSVRGATYTTPLLEGIDGCVERRAEVGSRLQQVRVEMKPTGTHRQGQVVHYQTEYARIANGDPIAALMLG